MDNSAHRSRKREMIALIGFLLVAGFFLVTEHTAHFLGALPYLIFLVCPLMHLFMRHHHGQKHDHHHSRGSTEIPTNPNGRLEGKVK